MLNFDDLYMGGRVELDGEFGTVYRDEFSCEIHWDYTTGTIPITPDSKNLKLMRCADPPVARGERLYVIRRLEADGVLSREHAPTPGLLYWWWHVNAPERLPAWLLWQYQRFNAVRWYPDF